MTITPAAVAVIVPVGGKARHWSRSAGSLARLHPPPGEIVAVIDGSNREQAACATEIGATVVALRERGGPARARNRGAQATSRDVLLFVDADVEVPVDLVAKVSGVFSAHPELAAVMGSYDDAPGDPGFFSQYRNLLHHFVHQNARETASTFWAGCGAVRSSVFRNVGGFDERFIDPSIEDIELGSRLRRAGYTIRLAKDIQVKHLKRWRPWDMMATDLWRRAVPWTELMLREGKLVNDLNVKSHDRVSVVTAFIPFATVPAAWVWPSLLLVAAASVMLPVVLNARLFWFFLRSRGTLFALGTIPLYWLYLLICGLGFGLGLVRHTLTGAGRARTPTPLTR